MKTKNKTKQAIAWCMFCGVQGSHKNAKADDCRLKAAAAGELMAALKDEPALAMFVTRANKRGAA